VQLLRVEYRHRRGARAKKYLVELTDEERNQWLTLLKKGKGAARTLCRAQILLQADEGVRDALIATTLHTGIATVDRTRKRFVEEGLTAALTERRRLGGQPNLQGKAEAVLIATACSVPPNGRQRWTLQLLAERLVEGGVGDAISEDTVGRTLKKTP
jgi:transposase